MTRIVNPYRFAGAVPPAIEALPEFVASLPVLSVGSVMSGNLALGADASNRIIIAFAHQRTPPRAETSEGIVFTLDGVQADYIQAITSSDTGGTQVIMGAWRKPTGANGAFVLDTTILGAPSNGDGAFTTYRAVGAWSLTPFSYASFGASGTVNISQLIAAADVDSRMLWAFAGRNNQYGGPPTDALAVPYTQDVSGFMGTGVSSRPYAAAHLDQPLAGSAVQSNLLLNGNDLFVNTLTGWPKRVSYYARGWQVRQQTSTILSRPNQDAGIAPDKLLTFFSVFAPRDMFGYADSSVLAYWPDNGNNSNALMPLRITQRGNGRWEGSLANATGGTIMQWSLSDTAFFNQIELKQPHWLAMTIDVEAVSVGQPMTVWLDGVKYTLTPGAIDEDIGFNRVGNAGGGWMHSGSNTSNNQQRLNQNMYEIWFQTGVTLNFDDPATVAKFWDVDKQSPVDLGPSGNLPTGASAAIFLRQPIDAIDSNVFRTNLGTVVGSFVNHPEQAGQEDPPFPEHGPNS